MSHIPVFEGIAEAGFDGLEISVVGQDRADLRTMRTAVADLGMSLTTSTFVRPEANPVSPEPAIRAAAVDYLKARVDEAHELGSEILVGGIYQAHKEFTGRGPTDQEWEWSRQYLRTSGEYAREARYVTVGFYCGLGMPTRRDGQI